MKLISRLADEIALERARQTIHFGHNVTLDHVQKRIADYCNISIDSVKSIKLGRMTPSVTTALKMAQYFDCKVEELFRLESDEPNVKENV